MKTDAEKKFNSLMKEVMENTDFDDDFYRDLKEAGFDKPPSYEALKIREGLRNRRSARLKKARLLKIAGFALAVVVVSGAMKALWNSDFISARRE